MQALSSTWYICLIFKYINVNVLIEVIPEVWFGGRLRLLWWLSDKESDCNTGDEGLIPGSGRSSGEGNGNPLQYSWDSLVAKTAKNLPAMQETSIPSLGQEDLLEKGMATHSSILAWSGVSHGLRSLAGYRHGCKESHMTEWITLSHYITFTLQDLYHRLGFRQLHPRPYCFWGFGFKEANSKISFNV